MLAQRISAASRFGLSRNFSTSVCVLAGMPSMDANGAAIMASLKERAGGKIDFFGLGGEKMVNAGLQDNFGCLNKLPEKPLYMFNNANPHHRERLYAIYMAATRFKNWRVVKEIEGKLHTQLKERNPAAVLALGNEYFMKRLYLKIDQLYADPRYEPTVKPAMLHYDRLMIGQTVEHLKYLDHYFYTVPYHPPNWQHYTFPSTFSGSQGLFDAYSYLYKQSSKYSGLVSDKGIYLNPEYNSIIMEELILESRAAFRTKYSISEESTVFFGSLGSDRHEIKWSVPIVQKAVNMFLEKFSKVSPENFTVVLSLPHDLGVTINALKWKCRVVIVTERNDRFGAMTAADLGVSLNGDAVTECAGLQLPTLILDKMDGWHTYWMLLYNQFNNNLSIAASGEVYPELAGMNFPGKLVELWGEWYLNPKMRYKYIRRFDKLQLLPRFLPAASGAETQQVVTNNLPFDYYRNPREVVADKLWEVVQEFESRSAKPADHHQVARERKGFVAKINKTDPKWLF